MDAAGLRAVQAQLDGPRRKAAHMAACSALKRCANNSQQLTVDMAGEPWWRDYVASQEVVEQMAQNARIKAGTDLAVSVSGVAGPDGGTSQKPVGTVWVALATRNSIASHCYQLNGDRTRIRGLTTNLALLALHSMVRKQEIPGWLPNPS